ncbi:MAG: apolipoprotein N-acyltransferase [Hyphomicrobiaceae bacterium]
MRDAGASADARPAGHAVSAVAAGVAGVAVSVCVLRGWRRLLAALIAGGVSVLALPPFFLSPVLLLTLPVLVWLIDEPSHRRDQVPARRGRYWRAALAGWTFGFAYFVLGLFWIGEAFLVEAEKFAWLLPAAVTLLPAFLAIFFGVAAAAAVLISRPGLSRVLALAITLSIAEWLRGHILTGLPWNVLGYVLTPPGVLLQSASLFGIYGLTLLAVVAFAAPLVRLAEVGRRSHQPSMWRYLDGVLVAAAIVGGLSLYGLHRLSTATDESVAGVKLRIVQPSIPQREKWRPEKQREIFDSHLDLSRRNASGQLDDLAGITHVVWPEAAMPFMPLESPQALAEIADLLPDDVYLLTGALRAERPAVDPTAVAADPLAMRRATRVYNSLMVLNGRGGLSGLYDKIHLVPFGEYLPIQSTLESIGLEQLTRMRGGFAAGRSPRPIIDVPGLPPLTALICYEAIFPAAVVQGDDRPAVIVNATNDGWFGQTTGPYQHFHMARVRAVEEGVPLIRAANNGISALIDPFGRYERRLGLDERGVIDTALPLAISPPVYARLGDVVFLGLIIIALFTLSWSRRAHLPQ